jgi:hypothetical protein
MSGLCLKDSIIRLDRNKKNKKVIEFCCGLIDYLSLAKQIIKLINASFLLVEDARKEKK